MTSPHPLQSTSMVDPVDDDDNDSVKSSNPLVIDEECLPYSYGPKISPPITLLQEICSRNGFTAEYQLLSTEGSVHEPTFKIAVTVNDITVTASGQSKKKARHAAAREAIERLRSRTHLNFDGINFSTMTSIGEPETKSSYEVAINEANPVGKLQEICMKMRVNPPDYETCDERGLAHERIFILSCSISSLNLTTIGEGRSKKLAKRHAAEHMLAKLESSELYDKSTTAKTDEQAMSSLNMDNDDNSHFVKERRRTHELWQRLDCSIEDLRTDISMIENEEVNQQLFYELFEETFINSCNLKHDYDFISENVCILNLYDREDNYQFMSTYGSGRDNIEAMKNAVISTYKNALVMKEGLIGRDRGQVHRVVEMASPLEI